MHHRPARVEPAAPHLVDYKAAADVFKVHPMTIRRRIADGTITGYKVGRMVRVDLDECGAAFTMQTPAKVERPNVPDAPAPARTTPGSRPGRIPTTVDELRALTRGAA